MNLNLKHKSSILRLHFFEMWAVLLVFLQEDLDKGNRCFEYSSFIKEFNPSNHFLVVAEIH